MTKKPRLFLLDGHSLAFRAFFALPLLSTSTGRYTNAAHGFAMMLTRLLDDHKPEYIACTFDRGKPTVRLDRYAEYKGTRQKTPTEMSEQIPYIKQILDAFHIPILEIDGHEADDIIGTLSAQAEAEGLQTMIVTGDKDALQLVSPSTHVLLTKRGITDVEEYDVAAVEARYSLVPHQLIDLKALMGDTSDNIPGVPGIGEKTGVKLLTAAGSLDVLLAEPEKYASKKQLELLTTYGDQARLSQYLATIVRDLELDLSIRELKRQATDYQALATAYREYEMRSLLDRLPEVEGVVEAQYEELDAGEWLVLEQDDEWDALQVAMAEQDTCSLAYRLLNDRLAVALSPGDGRTYVVADAGHHAERLNALLHLDNISFVGYDLKGAITTLAGFDVSVGEFGGDVLLAAYLLEPSQTDYSLIRLTDQYLRLTLTQNGDDVLAELAAECSAIAPLLEMLEGMLEERELAYLYRQVELPLSAVLGAMELQGVHVDKHVLVDMQQSLDHRLNDIMSSIYEAAGETFNINSPKQLGVVLFEKLKLPIIKKTKTGYSTDAEVLEALADQHAVVSMILEYRQLAKLKSTYLDGLLQVINPADQKVHTTYHQTVTTTGRLSSSEPNLQNIPVRLQEGREIRRAFGPSPGFDLILTADYSQIELRILAHISQDPIMMKAFIRDEDIHTRTAAEVFGVDPDLVSREMRSRAKAVNFGIVYGISDYGLSRDLKITRAEAKAYIESYFTRYAGVKNYIDRVIKQAREDGYVTTLLNRRRYLPDINSRNFNLRSFAERTAMNTPIQGSAADQIKLAMVNIDQRLRREGYKSKMILQVHDELIFDVCKEELDKLAALVRHEMETALSLLVPLKVDLKMGTNWYNVKPYQPS